MKIKCPESGLGGISATKCNLYIQPLKTKLAIAIAIYNTVAHMDLADSIVKLQLLNVQSSYISKHAIETCNIHMVNFEIKQIQSKSNLTYNFMHYYYCLTVFCP